MPINSAKHAGYKKFDWNERCLISTVFSPTCRGMPNEGSVNLLAWQFSCSIGKVYFFPSDAERVCCVDPAIDEVKLIGPIFLEGMNKWQILGVLWFCCSMPWNLRETWVGTSLGSPPTTMESTHFTATIAQLVACIFWSLADSRMGSWLAGKSARSGMASPLEMEHLSSHGDDGEGRILACGIWQFFVETFRTGSADSCNAIT